MSETIVEFLDRIGIEPDGDFIDEYYVLDLYTYDIFNSVYTQIERDIEIERDSDLSSLNEKDAHITYTYKNLIIELVAIFDDDSYTLNIFEEED